MNQPHAVSPTPHRPLAAATPMRAELWEPVEAKQMLVVAALLFGPALVGALVMGAMPLAEGALDAVAFGLVGGGLMGLIGGGIPLLLVGLVVTLVLGPRFPENWFHRRTHVLDLEHGRVLLHDVRGGLLGDTRASTLFVQPDNVLRHIGKHRVLAGALKLIARDGSWVRVVGRTVIAPWPALAADSTDFREVEDEVFRALQSVSS